MYFVMPIHRAVAYTINVKCYNNANTGANKGDGLTNMLRAKGEYCVVFKEKIFILV